MIDRRSVLIAAAATLYAAPGRAHHGWGTFDRSRTLEISGPVQRSVYANPHGMVVLVRGADELTFELAPVSRMRARGLAEADLAPGRTVRLFGYQNTRTPTLYRAEWIEVEGRRIELR